MYDPLVVFILSLIMGLLVIGLGLYQRKSGVAFFVPESRKEGLPEEDEPALAADATDGVLVVGCAVIGMGLITLLTNDATTPINMAMLVVICYGIYLVHAAVKKHTVGKKVEGPTPPRLEEPGEEE